VIRRATPADYPWMVATGAQVYQDLGNYDQILPSWLAQPGVLAWIDEGPDGAPRGFALLGFYMEPAGSGGAQAAVADLLAIAVAAPHQRRGIGSALLQQVISVAGRVGPQNRIDELRLTVAEHNVVGQRMYDRAGFRVVDAATGHYAGGQRALRMVRRLP